MFWLRDPPVLSDCHRHLVTGSFVEESEGSSSCSIFETALQDWLRHDGSGTTVLCLLFWYIFVVFFLCVCSNSPQVQWVCEPPTRDNQDSRRQIEILCVKLLLSLLVTSANV